MASVASAAALGVLVFVLTAGSNAEQPYRTVPQLNEPLDPLTEAPDVATHGHRPEPQPVRVEAKRAVQVQSSPD